MKKYTNSSHTLVCIEFEGKAQFLRRGESVTTDEVVKKLPIEVVVEEVTVAGESDKKTKTVKNPK